MCKELWIICELSSWNNIRLSFLAETGFSILCAAEFQQLWVRCELIRFHQKMMSPTV